MPEKNAKSKPHANAEGGANLLDKLDDAEAASILRELLNRHSELRTEAEAVFREILAGISPASVADQIEDALLQFDYDDLNRRAGSHSWGYVEPGEAAGNYWRRRWSP